jgi:protein involved in polysaccharide export with SLBB domain
VTGSVRNPAIYELLANEPLSGLLADAGGVSSVASEARVSIERVDDHRDRHAMEVAYDASGLATQVTDGDLIRVYSIVPIYRKTVTLRGNTSNPGRFAWHPGMRVSDLIPDKESLLTRNYWWKRAQRGLPVPEGANAPTQSGLPPQTEIQSGLAPQTEILAGLATQTEIRALVPEIDWDYAVIERLDTETLNTHLIPFDLGKLVLEHDASQDLELQPGDVVAIFSQADIRVPIAQQTKSVRLDGEFVHSGVYTAQPGETLRQLVERAGGLTSNAYLYASEFTRESTRALQQARMDQYVQNLSVQIQRSNLALASSPVNSTQDLSSGLAAQSSERDILARLHQIRATGRIVFRLTPGSNGTVSLPDIKVEDGDSFTVPPVPSTVNVVGAVYDQNSFLYARRTKVGNYLAMAGGRNRDADEKHAYLIRANGEVVSREKVNGFWGNEFNSLRVYPGDTIIVPEKTFKPSVLRGVLDWSQMFSQFALGAAAISVIK